jgi:hypothetical protein
MNFNFCKVRLIQCVFNIMFMLTTMGNVNCFVIILLRFKLLKS